MTIRTRRKIFYTLVALFIVLGGGVVFYAQGWRLDFSTGHLTKIGGIYIRSYPENVTIVLNGKPIQNDAGFLSQGTLISNLLPRTYHLTLSASGYDTWQEDAAVAPSLVTQFKYAVLVPTTSTFVSSSTAKIIAAEALAYAARTTTTTKSIAKSIASSTIPGKNVVTQSISGNVLGLLQNDGELYLYNTNANDGAGAVTKLADDVKTFSATDDGTMVAALEHNSLEIFSLVDASVYYRFNIPDVAATTRVIWYRDRTHLFIVYPDHVSFLDLADTSLTNFTTVARGTKPYYDPQLNEFYITGSDGALVGFSFSG